MKTDSLKLQLSGDCFYDQNLYLEQFQELVEAVDNPRYLIIIPQKNNRQFYAVPSLLASHKEKAQTFFKEWSKYLPDSQLVYTRSESGREVLLRAKSATLLEENHCESERLEIWE